MSFCNGIFRHSSLFVSNFPLQAALKTISEEDKYYSRVTLRLVLLFTFCRVTFETESVNLPLRHVADDKLNLEMC